MSTPLLKFQAGVFQFTWDEEQVDILVDRIRDHRGTLTGELTIKSLADETLTHLHHTRLNLLSTRDRQILVQEVSSRVNDLPWADLIEQCCTVTVRKYREGEPVVDVGNLEVKAKPRYRLSPLVLENEANLIYGPGGSCKSLLACTSAALVQAGEKRCGLAPIQGEVLYVDYETSQEEVGGRIQRIKKSLDLSPTLVIHYQRWAQPLADDIETLRRKVLETNAELIIVDSVGAACGGEPESAEIVLRYFMGLRSLNKTTLSIDHTSRKGEGPFGSVYKFNSARNVWEIKKSEEPGDGHVTVGLYHRKINSGRLLKPLGFKFTFVDTEDSLRIERVNVKDVPELATGLQLREQIAGLLQHGAMTAKDIAEELHTTDENVRVQLNRHKDMFTKPEDHLWGLLSKGN